MTNRDAELALADEWYRRKRLDQSEVQWMRQKTYEQCADELRTLAQPDVQSAALAEQEAEITRWKDNAATQQASAESCMQQALKNGSAALTAEAALNEAVGLLRLAIDDSDAPNYFGTDLLDDIDTFLAQHTTPPADGG
ncbi:MAG: hypothetical protein M3R16_00825 [Pseudomonadota bacterium]|nr:hypothetical protein [Pseudomonadota bacterium]